jgi:hypothetical protein
VEPPQLASRSFPLANYYLYDHLSTKCLPFCQVAVKCLRIDIADDGLKKVFTEVCETLVHIPICSTTATQRLEHELQQNTKLKHRNLLPLMGITRGFGPLPALVSPWMHNGSLTMLLDRDFQHLTNIRMLQIVGI